MPVAADYADNRACPFCLAPASQLGTWAQEDGKWYWKARPVFTRRFLERPEYNPERFDRYTRTITVVNERTGVEKAQQVEEWLYVVTHHCERDKLGAEFETCGVLQQMDTVPYRGQTEQWMLAPEPPVHKEVPTPKMGGEDVPW